MINVNSPKHIKWFEFRKRSLPILFPVVYYFRPYTKVKSKFPAATVITTNLFSHIQQQFLEWNSFQALQRFLVSLVLKRPQLLDRQVRSSRRFAASWLAWCRQELVPERLQDRSSEQLIRLYKHYQSAYERYSMMNVIYWVFLGDALIDLLNQRLKRYCPSANEQAKALSLLSRPKVLSTTRQEELALLRLAQRFPSASQRQRQLLLQEHSRKFGMIPWNYIGPSWWDAAAVLKRVTAAMKKGDLAIHQRVIRAELRQLRQEQKAVIRSKHLPVEIVSLVASVQAETVLQEDKKFATTVSHYYLHHLHKETARRLKMPWHTLYLFSFDEIAAGLRGQGLPDVRQRQKGAIAFIYQGKIEIISGTKALKWRKFFQSDGWQTAGIVKGTTAVPGKAAGTAKVVVTPADFKKVRVGDILVTHMTTPDYISVMKKAAAIVTDEGGLTSHAVIVSRELKKPCIIGTKVATQVFNDGEQVEVDATKGVAHRISK